MISSLPLVRSTARFAEVENSREIKSPWRLINDGSCNNMLCITWTFLSFLSNARIVLCQSRIKVFSSPGTIDPLRRVALDGV